MVRFSDIVGTKGKKRHKAVSPEEGAEKAKLWLSATQILKMGGAQDSTDLAAADKDREKVKKYYKGLLQKAMEIRDRVKEDQGITHSPVLSVLHHVIDEDLIDKLYAYAVSMPGDEGLPYIPFPHTISVTAASIKVGSGMGYDTKDLLKLGLAAFLENVGMYKVPDHILKKEGPLGPEEIAQIRKHPEISAQILGRMGPASQWLAEVALQVHERADGSGYPRGLKGEETSEFASIIGLLDTYVAMITDRPYRNRYIQTEAVKSIVELGKGKFPSKVVKEFLNQISLFPVNTYVRLNNKSIGRVLVTHKSQPLRPTIELIYDGLGRKMEKRKIVHLSKSPLLNIVDTIDGKKLP